MPPETHKIVYAALEGHMAFQRGEADYETVMAAARAALAKARGEQP